MKKIFLSISVALLTVSCSRDYLDVNNNPNQLYNDQVTPKERLAAAETGIFNTQAITLNRFGNLMMNAWAGNHHFYASPFQNEFTMNVDSNFYDGIWDSYYVGVGRYQAIIDAPSAADYPYHVAAAKVMKAFYMQTIVDLYNDVPYSEAFKGYENKSPKYDKAEDIYKSLIEETENALELLNASGGVALEESDDPIMKGNIAKWKQMANAVKLRLLVRLSNCTDPDIVSFRNQHLATLSTSDYPTEDILINPGYAAASSNQNPFYSRYGLVSLATQQFNRTYRLVVASEHIIDNMKGATSRTNGLMDYRIFGMWRPNAIKTLEGYGFVSDIPTPTTQGFYGIKQGSVKDLSRVESDFAMLNKPVWAGLGSGSKVDGIVMSLAEIELLRSEAAVVYPSYFNNAQFHFNQGVIASYAYFGGQIQALAPGYLAQSASKPGVGWASSSNKLEAIQYQRWIALTNINPVETFIGYVKTGYPVTPMPEGTNAPRRPYRLMYPQSEYVANSSNVPNISSSDVFEVNDYTPFWKQ